MLRPHFDHFEPDAPAIFWGIFLAYLPIKGPVAGLAWRKYAVHLRVWLKHLITGKVKEPGVWLNFGLILELEKIASPSDP